MIIRHNGERHEFGPRTVPFLGTAETRKEVEEWTFRKHSEIQDAAKKAAEREEDTPESVTFSELVERFRTEVVPTLAPNTQAAYADTFKPAEDFFTGQFGDPLLEAIRKKHVTHFSPAGA